MKTKKFLASKPKAASEPVAKPSAAVDFVQQGRDLGLKGAELGAYVASMVKK